MKRRNRDLVLFNLSALDVLATATGVFVLLAVLLMPYFRKTLEAHAEIADVRASVADTFLSVPGTSCSQKIRVATGRRVLHPIEILRLAVGAGQSG